MSREREYTSHKTAGETYRYTYMCMCFIRAIMCIVNVEFNLLLWSIGVHGWFPLFPPIHSSDTHDSAPGQIGNPDPNGACSYVGGVEVSLSLANKDDRKLILARGLDMGWKIPEGSGINMDYSDQPTQPEPRQEGRSENVGGGSLKHPVLWKFDVKLTELWVSAEAVAIPLSEDPAPYMYCFVRYRFFNSGARVVKQHQCLHTCILSLLGTVHSHCVSPCVYQQALDPFLLAHNIQLSLQLRWFHYQRLSATAVKVEDAINSTITPESHSLAHVNWSGKNSTLSLI